MADKSLSWAQFARAVCQASKDTDNPCVIKGVMEMGPKYSMKADMDAGNMDSLSIAEMTMKLEEVLENGILGKEDSQITDENANNAKNIGDLYVGKCKELGIETNYEGTPDLSEFNAWLDAELKRKPLKPVKAA